jgi:hypothetical protein
LKKQIQKQILKAIKNLKINPDVDNDALYQPDFFKLKIFYVGGCTDNTKFDQF